LATELFKRGHDGIVVVLEDGLISRDNPEELVWATLANIDPERDCIFDERLVTEASGRSRLVRHPKRLVIDATSKDKRDGFERDWPRKQLHPPEVLARVHAFLTKAGVKL
jgi:3-polyprenyl-4-hydroxybenzoate decarboxylase